MMNGGDVNVRGFHAHQETSLGGFMLTKYWNLQGITSISDLAFQNRIGFFYEPIAATLVNVPAHVGLGGILNVPNLVIVQLDEDPQKTILLGVKPFYYPYPFKSLRVVAGGPTTHHFYPAMLQFAIHGGCRQEMNRPRIPLRAYNTIQINSLGLGVPVVPATLWDSYGTSVPGTLAHGLWKMRLGVGIHANNGISNCHPPYAANITSRIQTFALTTDYRVMDLRGVALWPTFPADLYALGECDGNQLVASWFESTVAPPALPIRADFVVTATWNE